MMYETWLGCNILTESQNKRFLGFLIDDTENPDVLYLHFYSDAYNKYTCENVCNLSFTDLVTLVANGENKENLLKDYLVEKLPPQYQNRPHTFFIPEALMLTILADVSLLDMSEQPCPDYEADPDSIYYPDEDVEFEGDADFMFDD